MKLTDDGVAAHMRLNSDIKIPANSTATVKSVSAVGEQYVDLVPPDDPSQALLRDGSTIPKERTAIPQDIAELLSEADKLVSSLNNTRLQDLLRETFKAFNGSGPELARLIQSARLLIDEANASWPQTSALIDQAGPFLEAQIRSGDDIRSSADGLARFTTEVANADPQVRSLLADAPGAAAEASETFAGIRPSFPVLAANLANFGRIGVIYHRSIEQALVIFPALQAALITIAGQLPTDEGGKQDFKISINDPPPVQHRVLCRRRRFDRLATRRCGNCRRTCIAKWRRTIRPWCAARGITRARSSPVSARRRFSSAATRKGYVPIGNSPWRGPPVPVGTPMDVNGKTTRPRPDETSCRPTSSHTSHRRTIRTRDTPSRRVWCRPGCSPARGRRRINRGRTSRLRTTTGRRLRARRGYRRRRIRTRGHRPGGPAVDGPPSTAAGVRGAL